MAASARAKAKCKACAHKKKKGAMKGVTVKSGGKLSVKKGAGLTQKGRDKINRETGSNLQAPVCTPKSEKEAARRKSFCARSRGWNGERGKAARKRWCC